MCRAWQRAHTMLQCCLHACAGPAARLHATSSQCCLRIAADAPLDSSERSEALSLALEHAHLAVDSAPADALAQLCLLHAQLCAGDANAARASADRLRRLTNAPPEYLHDLLRICEAEAAPQVTYSLATALLCLQQAQAAELHGHGGSGLAAKLLGSFAAVLRTGTRMLQPYIRKGLPAVLRHLLPEPCALHVTAPAETNGALRALLGHVCTIQGALEGLVEDDIEVRRSHGRAGGVLEMARLQGTCAAADGCRRLPSSAAICERCLCVSA